MIFNKILNNVTGLQKALNESYLLFTQAGTKSNCCPLVQLSCLPQVWCSARGSDHTD
jgi:hypothetical protein